jgi:hypothetical protein
LGDVLHLTQDMAQPQHTRNEAHSGLGGRFSNNFTGHTSVFEKYLDSRARQEDFEIDGQQSQTYDVLDFGSHAIPTFSTYRDYWSTAVGVDGAAAREKGVRSFVIAFAMREAAEKCDKAERKGSGLSLSHLRCGRRQRNVITKDLTPCHTHHVHLLLTPARADSAGLLMKHLGQRYVQYINRTYQRSGTLWEGRFRSCLT